VSSKKEHIFQETEARTNLAMEKILQLGQAVLLAVVC
jgi:hypothetical protein